MPLMKDELPPNLKTLKCDCSAAVLKVGNLTIATCHVTHICDDSTTLARPACTIHFDSGSNISLSGDDAKAVLDYLDPPAPAPVVPPAPDPSSDPTPVEMVKPEGKLPSRVVKNS